MFKILFFLRTCLFVLPLFAFPLPILAQDDAARPLTEDPDELVVSAERVSIEEVIEAIGRKMEQELYRMEDISYTTLVTQILRDDPGMELSNYTIEEYAVRFHQNRGEGAQVVKLWERSRKFENGEVVEDEVDEKIEAEWMNAQDDALQGMPFAPGGAGRYNYTILDRRNVGNSLIYKVRFEPKSRFEALPTGVVWVDYSNWAIRKAEAEMIETVPYPLFIKSLPAIRISRQRVGDYWFTTEVYGLIFLRKVPLLPIPRSVEVRVTMQDIEINGKPATPENAIPETALPGTQPDEAEIGDFWLSPEAHDDSLAVYWRGIDKSWEKTVSPELAPVTLEVAKLDSLSEVGTAELTALQEGGRWQIGPSLTPPQYNRAQGFAPFVGLSARKTGPAPPRMNVAAGYGFGNRRWLGTAEFDIPLIRSRWNLADGKGKGRHYKLLTLNLQGVKTGAQFAGDGRRYTRSASAVFYGSDPNHYYENRGGAGRLMVKPARRLDVYAGAGYYENRVLEQRTSWNLLGRQLRPDGNYRASALDERRLYTGGNWGIGPVGFSGYVVWHNVRNSDFVRGLAGAPTEADFRQVKLSGTLDLMDRSGNQWLLRGGVREFDRQVPVQWKTWMGDYGTLRGYPAGVLTGDGGSWASLDLRLGWDMWRALRVPVLKKLGLQPIGFADYGHTWSKPGPYAEGPEEGARDWRADVGFGFGRRFDLPGLGEFNNFRMYAATPVGNGREGHGWRFLIAFEK
ncbi:MAG: hypothetical protein ABFS42_10090 [Candidatus Krumholzibacteriota bacterium]